VAVGYRVGGELVGLVAVNAPQAFNAITRTMLASARSHMAIPAANPAPVSGPVPLPVALSVAVAGTASAAVPRERGGPAAGVPGPAGVPRPAGPPPISGPVPVRPRLYAVQ
jgi:hypothetical protein